MNFTESAPTYSKLRQLYEIYYGFFPNKPTFTLDDYPDLIGKIAIVTGSNSGVGYQTTKLLYKQNCNVIMVVRSESKGLKAGEQIKKEVSESKGSLTVISGCDFGDLSLMKGTASKIEKYLDGRPLNIIIHNAGFSCLTNDQISKQHYELNFQTNAMGPQLLQHFLDPLFLRKDSNLKRIVWVTSITHSLTPLEYGINWTDPTYENTPLTKRPTTMILYGQSKAAVIYQAKAWATKNKDIVDDIGCISVSCYPGNLKSNFCKDYSYIKKFFIYLFFSDCIYGAYSELFAALNPKFTISDQGKYIGPFGEVREPREDIQTALVNGVYLKLWDYIEERISKFY